MNPTPKIQKVIWTDEMQKDIVMFFGPATSDKIKKMGFKVVLKSGAK
jgi:hypothetical protein